jgi:hypothetical protein
MASTPVTTQRLADGTMQWSLGEFVTVMRVLSAGVVYCASAGDQVFIPEFAQALAAEIETHGHVVIFVNMLEAARLSGSARDSWAAWAKKHKQGTSAHFLVRSKLVDMGLSLIAMFSGADMRSYSDAERFLAAMREAAPQATLPKLRDVA